MKTIEQLADEELPLKKGATAIEKAANEMDRNCFIAGAKAFQTQIGERKKLVQLRTKLEFSQKLSKKLEKVLNAELEIEDWASEVYEKKRLLENELDEYKLEIDLSDEEWNEDEKPY